MIMTKTNNKKVINEIEKIYKEYIVEMKKLRDEQDELFKSYTLNLEKKKKDELLKSIKNFKD